MLKRFPAETTTLLLTPQHTGTWFAVEALKLSPQVEFCEVRHACQPDWRRSDRPLLVLHQHIRGDGPYRNCFPAEWEETLDTRMLDLASLQTLTAKYRTVITIRDPLRAVITRWGRVTAHWGSPQLEHWHIINAFLAIASVVAAQPENVLLLPVDLKWPESERVSRLRRMYRHCGLEPPDELDKYAARWQAPAYNVTPENPLAALYDAGDWPGLHAHVGKYMDRLSAVEGSLRPLLESLGYQGLSWWS